MDIGRRTFLEQSATFIAALSGAGTPLSTTSVFKPPHDFRQALLQCLGGSWPEPVDLNSATHDTVKKDGFRIETVSYDAEPGDRVSACLLIPDGVNSDDPAPGIAVWHQHNGQWHIGRLEPAGLAGNPTFFTGQLLAREGYVVLCPDALCFGDRRNRTLEGGLYEQYRFLDYLVMGKSLAWKNILDMRQAINYLCSRPEVQKENLGCFGHSMGAAFTWLVGPWEPRLKCMVGNCSLPTYAAIRRDYLLHSATYYIPGLMQYGDIPDIVALIAPRALHLNFGGRDLDSPIEDVRQALELIKQAYISAGANDMFTSYIEESSGHVFSRGMWEHTRDCFKRYLNV